MLAGAALIGWALWASRRPARVAVVPESRRDLRTGTPPDLARALVTCALTTSAIVALLSVQVGGALALIMLAACRHLPIGAEVVKDEGVRTWGRFGWTKRTIRWADVAYVVSYIEEVQGDQGVYDFYSTFIHEKGVETPILFGTRDAELCERLLKTLEDRGEFPVYRDKERDEWERRFVL